MKKFVFIFSAFMFVVSTLMVITYANFDEEPEVMETPTSETTTTSLFDTTTTTTTTTVAVEEPTTTANSTNNPSSETTTKSSTTKVTTTTKTSGGTTTQSTTVTTTTQPTTTTTTTTTTQPTTQPIANPVVTVSYNTSYLSKEVTVTLTSSKTIKSVSGTGWSKVDNYTYKKNYTTNIQETVIVTDNDNKTANKSVIVNNIATQGASLGTTTVSFTNITNKTQNGSSIGGKLYPDSDDNYYLYISLVAPVKLDKSLYDNRVIKINSQTVTSNVAGNNTVTIKVPMSSNSIPINLSVNWGNGKVETFSYTVTVSLQ